MFKNQTLIVVGAGASSECNLPTGFELKSRIASLLDIRFKNGYSLVSGDPEICDALRVSVQNASINPGDINSHLDAAWRIRDAMPQAISIDNFIDARQGDERLELCGKLAIVRAILEGERKSLLYVDPRKSDRRPNFDALSETWYTAFVQLLTENCRLDQLADRLSKIALVIFNYDRCVEHFLFHAIQNYYGINSEQAAELLRRLKIFHPYGMIGALPWSRGATSMEFGGEPSSRQLLELASQIKTFTESTDPDSSDVQAIRQHFTASTIVLFLGFAFHRLNLDFLKPGETHPNPENVRYFGTAKGMSDSDCAVVRTDLSALASVRPANVILRNDLVCGRMFREYWRSLSLA